MNDKTLNVSFTEQELLNCPLRAHTFLNILRTQITAARADLLQAQDRLASLEDLITTAYGILPIQEAELQLARALMDLPGLAYPAASGQSVVAPVLDVEAVSESFRLIELHNVRVVSMVMHPSKYSKFRELMSDMFEVTASPKLIRQGIMGFCWGAVVITLEDCDINTVVLLGEIKSDSEIPYYATITVTGDPQLAVS